jgi:hypothetical protein
MFDLQKFIIKSHEKIIGHYRQLMETSKSDEERERYRRSMEEHERTLQRTLDQSHPERLAA